MVSDNFIEKSKKVHGDKYDYSKVEYINNHTKVCIICPIHGEFWQTPKSHLKGAGCSSCSKNKKLTTTEFIKLAKEVHGDKYDYSKVEYINNHTKVCIICPIHGEFWQAPISHRNKIGCPYCAGRYKNTEEFIKRARKVHGDKYDYSKVEYINGETEICIICPIHGEFWQKPHNHIQGKGCHYCASYKTIDTEEFIKRARKVHGDRYDYSKVIYNKMEEKVCIICPIHGEFWQTPHNHLKFGCKKCKNVFSCLERKIEILLKNNNIKFEWQKTFDWLYYKKKMYLDFYLPDYNIAIECQGEQHFNKFRWENDNEKLEIRKKRDKIKKFLCEEINNIKVIYFSDKIHDDNIINNEEEILLIIKKIDDERNCN